MTAKRVASAFKAKPTIAAALKNSPEFVERAEKMANLINRRHPIEEPQDVESILWLAILSGLDEMERHYNAKEATS